MKLKNIFLLIPFLCALSIAKAQDSGTIRFAKIISDNMVLQQQKPITLWGWAKPKVTVKITLTQDASLGKAAANKLGKAQNAQTAGEEYSVRIKYVEKNPPSLETKTLETRALGDGYWRVEFPAAEASFQPTWIIAQSGDQIALAQNVLIGEIWICAGQSNMGWGNFNRKDREVASADFPGLRYIAWEDSWYKPLPDIRKNASWQECSPESAQRFSAVPYLYGMFLHRYLKVPVGIINVARGGTLGQTWCHRKELDTIDNKLMKTVLAEHDAQTAIWDDPKQVAALMDKWEKSCEVARQAHTQK
ncbi:MAG TPA: hypothetical protein DEB48_05875, partial [Verrucomicrobiales bacterium]|nr:hypothetical protein [Verrucomicrobiales bacterium]